MWLSAARCRWVSASLDEDEVIIYIPDAVTPIALWLSFVLRAVSHRLAPVSWILPLIAYYHVVYSSSGEV